MMCKVPEGVVRHPLFVYDKVGVKKCREGTTPLCQVKPNKLRGWNLFDDAKLAIYFELS